MFACRIKVVLVVSDPLLPGRYSLIILQHITMTWSSISKSLISFTPGATAKRFACIQVKKGLNPAVIWRAVVLDSIIEHAAAV